MKIDINNVYNCPPPPPTPPSPPLLPPPPLFALPAHSPFHFCSNQRTESHIRTGETRKWGRFTTLRPLIGAKGSAAVGPDGGGGKGRSNFQQSITLYLFLSNKPRMKTATNANPSLIKIITRSATDPYFANLISGR